MNAVYISLKVGHNVTTLKFIFKRGSFAIDPFSCNNSRKCTVMLILSEIILKTALSMMNNQAAIVSDMSLVKEGIWLSEC